MPISAEGILEILNGMMAGTIMPLIVGNILLVEHYLLDKIKR